MHGYTEIDFEDGTKFKGQYKEGEMTTGEVVFSNGYKYDGMFEFGKFHGKGKLEFPSGQVFQGNWAKG